MAVIRVLTPELKFKNEIDIFGSVRYKKEFRGAGEFELHLSAINGIEKYDFIAIDGDGHKAGIVRDITVSETDSSTEVIIKGPTLNGLLDQRIILGSDNADSFGYFALPDPLSEKTVLPAETIIKTYVKSCFEGENRSVPGFVIAPDQGRGVQTKWLARYESLEDVVIAICEECDCGYEIYIDFDTWSIVFEYLPQINKPGVVLSSDFETLSSLDFNTSIQQYKNVGYAGGAGENEERTYISVHEGDDIPSGIKRHETFFDCGSLSLADDYALTLDYEAEHRLKECKKEESFEVEVSDNIKLWATTDIGKAASFCRAFGLPDPSRILAQHRYWIIYFFNAENQSYRERLRIYTFEELPTVEINGEQLTGVLGLDMSSTTYCSTVKTQGRSYYIDLSNGGNRYTYSDSNYGLIFYVQKSEIEGTAGTAEYNKNYVEIVNQKNPYVSNVDLGLGFSGATELIDFISRSTLDKYNGKADTENGSIVKVYSKVLNAIQQKRVIAVTDVIESSRIARYVTLGDPADNITKQIKKLR